jgi:hypothetical protein
MKSGEEMSGQAFRTELRPQHGEASTARLATQSNLFMDIHPSSLARLYKNLFFAVEDGN